MTKDIETRYLSGLIEVRASEKGKKLGGYALKYNKMSQNLGGFVEMIAPGALNKTIADGGDVLCRYQHEDEFLLGRTSSGTLRLVLDDVGLDYEVDLPATSYANDLAVLADRGDVRFSSFAFYVIEDEWGLTEQGFPMRTLLQIGLVDVAPVVQPAYLDTTTGLRHLAEARNLDFETVRAAAVKGVLADLMGGQQTCGDCCPMDCPGGVACGDTCTCGVECCAAGCSAKGRSNPESAETPSEPHASTVLLRQKGDWLSRRPIL